jgi:VWFA-related protein
MKCVSACLLTVLFAGAVAGQDKDYRFEVEVDRVLLDVYVGRRGQPVEGLSVDDFEVLDNGVRQEITLVSSELTQLSTVLVLDISRSVHGEKYEHLVAAAQAFLGGLAERDQTTFLAFCHYVQRCSDWSHERDLIRLIPHERVGQGGTALHDALYAGLKLTDQPLQRPMLLVFTDGQDMHSRLSEEDVLEVVKESFAVVYIVGIAPDVEPSGDPHILTKRFKSIHDYHKSSEFLRKVAEISGGRFLDVRTSLDLEETFLRILSEMKDRYLLSFTPSGETSKEWHELEVKLKNVRAEVRARRGYHIGVSR